jgi:hypothetical protein
MGGEFDGGFVTLYDTRAYSPRRITVLTEEEMESVIKIYTDGLCPVCLEEIALNDVICDGCFEQVKQARPPARPPL